MLLLPYSTTLYITHTSGPQSAERHSTSPESLIHGRPKPAGCRRPRSVRLFVFLQHHEDLFASFACNWLFVKLTHDICHNHHNRLCKILLAQCKISQLEHEVKTQCKNLHIVLSCIYALSSENFLGLNLGLCKKNTNIRYGWTFNVSNLIVDLIAMFCPEIWTFWGLTHIQFFSLARSNTATIFFSWKEFSPCLQNSCDKVELSKTFRL